MTPRPTRRAALAVTAAAAFASPALAAPSVEARVTQLEQRHGGRIGLAALDTGSGRRVAHRADERFPMCSTFKMIAVSAVLHRVDTGAEQLDREVLVDRADVVGWAPVTEKHLGQKMSLGALCEAAIEFSDNGAANLILDALGGPQGVTSYARAIGDPMFRLDRREPALNEALPGDPRDTTTPAAMLGDLNTLLLGQRLSPPLRNRLTGWMLKCQTSRIKGTLPSGWRIADKTGSGGRGATNDVGVIWPPNRAPILIAVYTVGSSRPEAERNAAVADIGRIVVESL